MSGSSTKVVFFTKFSGGNTTHVDGAFGPAQAVCRHVGREGNCALRAHSGVYL